MNDFDKNAEVTSSLDNIKAWLAGRRVSDELDTTVIKAPEGLRSIGFADLNLEKVGPEHQESIVFCHDNSTQKHSTWTEFNHLLNWSTEFLSMLRDNKTNLSTLELVRGANEVPISLAKHHVEESINVLIGVLNFDVGVDIVHPDTRGHNYAATNILIEDSTTICDIVRQVFTCLYCKSVVRLVVKTNHFYSAALTAYIVDMMYQSGATKSEIKCVAYDRRESIGNEKFNKCFSPSKNSKLSTIAVVFKQTDTFAAAQGILECYFREQYPNLIVLVEESAYDRFVLDWQRYYSHAMFIGPRLDNRTTVVDVVNEKVQIDLWAIDIKASHKMTGNAINILKYRTISELVSLLNNLRKVPFMTIWNDDILLSREFCHKVNICSDFWINHVPKIVFGRKISEEMLNYYSETVAEDMANIYNSIYAEYLDEIEQLKKLQAVFMKKDSRLRTRLVIQAYTSLISRCKSLKNGTTISESVAKLKRFHQVNNYRVSVLEAGDSRIETSLKPAGIAILLVREESSIKSKPAFVEFIFKNLLIGNAVLLNCPPNSLGAKFSFENDHIIPFKMVHDSLPDISRLSLDSSIDESSSLKRSCPKNTYATEILPEMNNETFEMLTMALGSRRKNIWYPYADQTNYWSNE